jgi:hypothetical protein
VTGSPHLATRILAALSAYVSSPWRAWIAWELALSGGESAASFTLDASVRELVALAARGDRVRFAAGIEQLLRSLAGCAPFRSDVDALRGALDPESADEGLPEPVVGWRRGAIDAIPLGLSGLNALLSAPEPAHAPSAWVVVSPSAAPVRVLRAGADLACGEPRPLRLEPTQRHHGRTDCLLAVLAFAGRAGLADSELFERVYGFAFALGSHQEVLNVLIHRARQRLPPSAEIEHREGRTTLHARAPLLIPDPRCTRPVDERLLRLVAQRGAVRARELAHELGVPLRRVQESLKRLVDEGACARALEGAEYIYAVEDTTFLVPTSHR